MTAGTSLEAGLSLAERIAAAALCHDSQCCFFGATPAPTLGQPAHWRVFGGDVYEGSAGIARLLAYAHVLGAGGEVADVARGAIAHALARPEGWSLLSGGLGTGLVALELAPLLEAPALTAEGLAVCRTSLAAALADAEAGIAPLDLLIGLAGAVLGAVLLARHQPEHAAAWLESARSLAAGLAAAARPAAVGLAWPIRPEDAVPLCGLAHGAAGVALAFEALAAADSAGDTARWRLLADEARLFERMHFDDQAWSWADLRPDSLPASGGPPGAPHFWCHGSVGIAHDRMRAHRYRPDCPHLAADLAVALAGARREACRVLAGPAGPGAPWIANGSLCHGIAGFIDLLVETGDGADRLVAGRLSAFMANDARRPTGPRCGIPSGEPTPGLMLGQAGIAWGHLRAARPEAVPLGWLPGAGLSAQAAG